MSNAREIAQLGSVPSGRKNIIINGSHIVNQRGLLPVTGVTSGYSATDRWKIYLTGVSANTALTEDVLLSNGYYAKTLKATASSTATGALTFYQVVEDRNFEHLVGKTITASVWMRSNNANARLFLWNNSAVIGTTAHTGGGGWEYLTVTAVITNSSTTLECYAGIGDETNMGDVSVSSADFVEFTQVQLEVGSVATEFEHRSYGEELALCQRYYTKFSFPQTTHFFPSHRQSTNNVRSTVTTPVPLRANPSINASGQPSLRYHWDNGSSFLDTSGTSLTVFSSGLDANRFTINNGNVTGVGANIGAVFAYSGYLECNAEL